MKNTHPESALSVAHDSPSVVVSAPFLKWAGGKRRLLPLLLPLLPTGERLVEPFVGGGSVFLSTRFPTYALSDGNEDLMQVYKTVRDRLPALMTVARSLFVEENRCEEAYRHHRETFNTTDEPLLKAGLFIYLNRFGFNGLCRYNAHGDFNVPYGWPRKVPRLPVEELAICSLRLASAELTTGDFTDAMKAARPSDVVYCDPPYLDLNGNRSFTGYTASGFGLEQHEAIVDIAVYLSRKGVPVLISNHDSPQTRELYGGATLHSVKVRRSISADISSRKAVGELIAVFS